MTDSQFATLHRAVTLAKDRQIRSVKTLRHALEAEGHDTGDVAAAIAAWSAHEKEKDAGRKRMA